MDFSSVVLNNSELFSSSLCVILMSMTKKTGDIFYLDMQIQGIPPVAPQNVQGYGL